MEYVLVDTYGATLDVFEDLPSARDAVGVLISEDPAAGDELAVLPYWEGQRVGHPIGAQDFILPKQVSFARIVAFHLRDWNPKVVLTPSNSISFASDIEIEWEAEESELDLELLSPGHKLAVC
jgi:hypothetical protein